MSKPGEWTLYRFAGRLFDDQGALMTSDVYTGHGPGVNDPTFEHVHNIGPIPAGQWYVGTWFDDGEKGPIVSHLAPAFGVQTYGRTGFMVHGDNPQLNHTASHGCVILPRSIRIAMRDRGAHALEVI